MKTAAIAAAILATLLSARISDASPRTWQPLIVKGSQVAALVGMRIDGIEVLAMGRTGLEPIPFQVDEVLPDGRYALPDGPDPVADDSPGIVDPNDEIVLMISDM